MIKSIAQFLGIFFFGIFVSLLLVEVGLRVSGFGRVVTPPGDRPQAYYRAPAATLFRDFPETFPADATPKIAVVGDSFSFATAMQYDDAFPNKLERLLQQEGYPAANVVNYGVPGYSTSHERDAVVQAGREGAEILILQITLNDPQRKAYRPSGLTGKNEFGTLELSGFEKTLASYWRTYGFARMRLHNTETHNRYTEYYTDLFLNKRTWIPFKEAVTDIVRYCERENITLVAVVFPLFGMPLDDTYPFAKIHQRVANLFSRKEVPVLDLFSVYQGIPLAALQVDPLHDFHPNEYGHRLAAEAIYAWLRYDQKLLPQDL